MARTGVRVRSLESQKISTREVPLHHDSITYVVHPSTSADCDTKGTVQNDLNDTLAFIPLDERMVFILPPDGTSYISTDIEPTDVRDDSNEYRWVKRDDITKKVNSIRLVGGNLRRCLGFVGSDVIRWAREEGLESLELILPLQSIYSIEGHNIATEFNQLLTETDGDMALALVALLIAQTPYDSQKEY